MNVLDYQKKELTYFSLFVNYGCNFDCCYCSEKISTDNKKLLPKGKPLSAAEFLLMNKYKHKFPDRELIIHGGEPLLYFDLQRLLEGLEFPEIIVVSNLSLDIDKILDFDVLGQRKNIKFIGSYHPEYDYLEKFLRNVRLLKEKGMLHYICGVQGYVADEIIERFKQEMGGIRIYSFVGINGGEIFPEPMREAARGLITKEHSRKIRCRSTMLMIDPFGNIWNCHTHMYTNNMDYCLGNIRTGFDLKKDFFCCDKYYYCDPCQNDHLKFEK